MKFYSYRISIYTQKNQKSFSYSNFSKFSMDSYFKIEKKFLKIIFEIIYYLDIDELKISNLEIYSRLKKRKVKKLTLEKIIKYTLREKIWCKLISKDLEIHFGYDYYMYIVCQKDLFGVLLKYQDNLKIEKFISPYL